MLRSKVAFITGSSRGIGKAIAETFAREGAKVVVTGKTISPHSKLPHTIFSTARNINQTSKASQSGGRAIAIELDVRSEKSIEKALSQTMEEYGKIDILVNNASAVNNAPTSALSMKSYDLINQVNGRGSFMMTKHTIPYLLETENPHVITLSPPFNLNPEWISLGGVGYSISKYSMSLVTLGMSHEFRNRIAFNSLWPKYTIATEAIRLIAGKEALQFSLKPEIMADAACKIATQNVVETNNFYIAEELVDFRKYKQNPSVPLLPDAYVGDPKLFKYIHEWKTYMTSTPKIVETRE